MSFLPTDKTRIIKYRAYNLPSEESLVTVSNLSDWIDGLLANLEANLPDLIAAIQADLDSLDALDLTLNTEQGSTASGLIRADVLEWEPGGAKTRGIEVRFESIRGRIAAILSQTISGRQAGGMSRASRG